VQRRSVRLFLCRFHSHACKFKQCWQFSVLAANLKETEEALAFEKQMFSDLENKFMELQSKHTDAAAATFDSKRQTMAKSTDAASLRREIMAMETIQKVRTLGAFRISGGADV
jgi:hypothetical protein